MILSRTPFRISFCGGGTDLPGFYRKFGGAVLSSSIARYMFIAVNAKFDGNIRVSYSRTENVSSVEAISHPIIRETMLELGVGAGVEVVSIADIPGKGTGLGSSSAFTVGLVRALSAYQSSEISTEEVAKKACFIEMERCNSPIGKQDAYASCFGGLNYIEFKPDESVLVESINLSPKTFTTLNDNLMIFYTGIQRNADSILADQQARLENDDEKIATMKQMCSLAKTMRDCLVQDELSSFGQLLHSNWLLKRSLSPMISNGQIDDWYNKGREAGALGGKLLGAGAGGFLLFYAEKEVHRDIERSLPELRRVDLQLEKSGSQITYRS